MSMIISNSKKNVAGEIPAKKRHSENLLRVPDWHSTMNPLSQGTPQENAARNIYLARNSEPQALRDEKMQTYQNSQVIKVSSYF